MNAQTTTAQQVKFIRSTFSKVSNVLGSIGWTNYAEEIYTKALAEEKRHRKTWSSGATRFGISAADAAKMFAVRDLAKYLTGAEAPLTIEDVINCKESAVYACAVATKYAEQLRPVFTADVAAQAVVLDYVALIG